MTILTRIVDGLSGILKRKHSYQIPNLNLLKSEEPKTNRPYKANDVASYIANYAFSKDYLLDYLKIHDLLYIIQGFYLGVIDDGYPCFREEIESWDYDPRIPYILNNFPMSGNLVWPVEYYYVLDDPDNIWTCRKIKFDPDVIDDTDKKIIEGLVDTFHEYSLYQLTKMTREHVSMAELSCRYSSKRGVRQVITEESMRRLFKVCLMDNIEFRKED